MGLRMHVLALVLLPASVQFFKLPWSLLYQLLASYLVYFILRNWRWLRIGARTFRRDSIFVYRFGKLYLLLMFHVYMNSTLHKVFLRNVRKHTHKPCIKFQDETWTFQDVEEHSNRVAHHFKDQGCKSGDVIALLTEPSPRYICTWLGLAKIGCTTSLINLNSRKESLFHCLKECRCIGVILGPSFVAAVEEIRAQLSPLKIKYYIDGYPNQSSTLPLIEMDLQTWSTRPVGVMSSLSIHDPAVLIYTSGTTGLPKPAVISHLRCLFMSFVLPVTSNKAVDDVVYTPLPLYHSVGGMIGVGQALFFGSTVAIRPKFSASEFWNDCIKYEATSAQYIGEICRYLLNQPPRPCDKAHKVRSMFGNGLRKELWTSFKERFGVEQIGENYGSTEGNCGMININGRPGAVGYVPSMFPFIHPISLIKVDEDTLAPIRDENGLCVECQPGEPGELLGKISTHALRRFDGYLNKSESSKKMIRGVNSPNDLYFRSGDLLVRDEEWNFYFHDRLGDTYRWHGENISSTEVEGILTVFLDGRACIVHGVRIPGNEGRAGMAAIVDPTHSVDISMLSSKMADSLPSFAQPVFLRILNEASLTSTHKLKKIELKKLGFKLTGSNSRVYFKRRHGDYEAMTPQTYDDICNNYIMF